MCQWLSSNRPLVHKAEVCESLLTRTSAPVIADAEKTQSLTPRPDPKGCPTFSLLYTASPTLRPLSRDPGASVGEESAGPCLPCGSWRCRLRAASAASGVRAAGPSRLPSCPGDCVTLPPAPAATCPINRGPEQLGSLGSHHEGAGPALLLCGLAPAPRTSRYDPQPVGRTSL